jgi:tetratricopeptide (TPR) repeat protein
MSDTNRRNLLGQAVVLTAMGALAGSALVGSKARAQSAQGAGVNGVKALVFDVFGTVVDWRGGVAREAEYVDGRYLDRAAPGKFQGVLEDHWVEVDLGDDAQATKMIRAARERWPDDEYVLGWSVFVHLHRGDHEAALRDARRLLALNPSAWGASVALFVLRDADLKAGHPDVARARYAKAYPELFGTEPPKIFGWKLYISIDLALVLHLSKVNLVAIGATTADVSNPNTAIFYVSIFRAFPFPKKERISNCCRR